jgi:8-oxo-dGTP pyrophosphatase MutT (NUDIX family)
VLLVDPVYRDTWDLPGGAVEAEESPHAACREVAEELGLDGGVLTTKVIEAIVVQDGELAGFALVRPGQVARRVTPRWHVGYPHAWRPWPTGQSHRWRWQPGRLIPAAGVRTQPAGR